MASEPMQVPVLQPGYTYGTVSDKVNDVILKKGTPKGWLAAVGVSLLLVLVLLVFGFFPVWVLDLVAPATTALLGGLK